MASTRTFTTNRMQIHSTLYHLSSIRYRSLKEKARSSKYGVESPMRGVKPAEKEPEPRLLFSRSSTIHEPIQPFTERSPLNEKVCEYSCTLVYIVYMYVCLSIHINACVLISTCIHAYIYIYMCVCVAISHTSLRLDSLSYTGALAPLWRRAACQA